MGAARDVLAQFPAGHELCATCTTAVSKGYRRPDAWTIVDEIAAWSRRGETRLRRRVCASAQARGGPFRVQGPPGRTGLRTTAPTCQRPARPRSSGPTPANNAGTNAREMEPAPREREPRPDRERVAAGGEWGSTQGARTERRLCLALLREAGELASVHDRLPSIGRPAEAWIRSSPFAS